MGKKVCCLIYLSEDIIVRRVWGLKAVRPLPLSLRNTLIVGPENAQMEAMVEKKFSKLKNIANAFCKESVKEELGKVEAKRFKDVNAVTEWFVKLAGVR